jgi:phosphonate transport system substrate-binding protein
MKKHLSCAVLVLALTGLLLIPSAQAKEKYVMGVHPYKPPQELYKKFKPIADYLSTKLGKPVEFQIAQSYDDAANKVGTGAYDFAFLGPTIYVDAHDKYGVVPLAQIANNKKPVFHGVIVVKKGSGITSLKDLKGKSVAFGERHSTLTHLIPLWMLMDAGVRLPDLKEYRFAGTHDNVALNVARGAADAGGLMPDIAEKYKDQGIEVIARSPDLPEHVFAATKSMDQKTVDLLQNALVGMDIALAKGIKDSISNLQKFNDKDFDVLRKIMKQVGPELGK